MREGITFFDPREGFFGPDRLSETLRGKIREVILTLAEAELSEVLAALPYERKGERCLCLISFPDLGINLRECLDDLFREMPPNKLNQPIIRRLISLLYAQRQFFYPSSGHCRLIPIPTGSRIDSVSQSDCSQIVQGIEDQ